MELGKRIEGLGYDRFITPVFPPYQYMSQIQMFREGFK